MVTDDDSSQHGMWAMIACSIALAIWCAGLSWLHHKDDVARSLEGVEQDEPVKVVDDQEPGGKPAYA